MLQRCGVVLVLCLLKNREVGDFCKSARLAQHPITQREKQKKKKVESSPPNFLFSGKMYFWVQLLKTQDNLWRKRPLYFSRAANIFWLPRFFLGAPRICFSFVDCAEIFLCSFFVFFGAPYFFWRNAFLQPLRLPRTHSRLYSTGQRSSTARGHVPPFLWSATLNRPWSTLQ